MRFALALPLRTWMHRAFPRGTDGIDYDQPAGDPGLFGPDSVTWRVHADFPGMLAGGLCALMLQTLHPLALAGVWDHSDFRRDLVGRLRRTTTFVAATSYAGRAQALAQVERVRRIHARVRGVAEDGRAYAADDPALLTWVHVTEAYGFLAGYRRFAGRVDRADADRYYDEGRRVAEALGARDVPGGEAAVEAYFQTVRGELAFTARSREVLSVLEAMRLPVPLPGLSRDVFLGAGASLLPDWAETALQRSPAQRLQAAASARALATIAPMFRMALDDGPSARARRRVAAH